MAEGAVAGDDRDARDRATEYTRGAPAGATAAVQVLDRWQVLRNAREVAARILERHPAQLRALSTPVPDAMPLALPPCHSGHEEARRQSTRQRAVERHALGLTRIHGSPAHSMLKILPQGARRK